MSEFHASTKTLGPFPCCGASGPEVIFEDRMQCNFKALLGLWLEEVCVCVCVCVASRSRGGGNCDWDVSYQKRIYFQWKKISQGSQSLLNLNQWATLLLFLEGDESSLVWTGTSRTRKICWERHPIHSLIYHLPQLPWAHRHHKEEQIHVKSVQTVCRKVIFKSRKIPGQIWSCQLLGELGF